MSEEEAITDHIAAGQNIAQATGGSNANVNTNAPTFNINIIPNASSSKIDGFKYSEAPENSGASEYYSQIWSIPYQRNPLFTGREGVLKKIYDTLKEDRVIALTQSLAISGLGGNGKTQIAIEYAYRYSNNYQVVIWARGYSREVLTTDFVHFANLLKLPERYEQDQKIIVNSVKCWLESNTNIHWLLILDNVDNLAIIRDFIPTRGAGHILLTTCLQATGTIAQNIVVEGMEEAEAILFLLRRSKVISKNASLSDDIVEIYLSQAKEIVHLLGAHPLALDQAGAYIEETACNLSDYLTCYLTQRSELLKRRGNFSLDHPESVTTTWSLSFDRIKTSNPLASELLSFFAFLAPDAIPEEIVTISGPHLGSKILSLAENPLLLGEAISTLRAFSLIHRNADKKTLTVHRLVQAVLRDEMDEDMQHQWAERTLEAINYIFSKVTYTNWNNCQRYLPHAQNIVQLIEKWAIKQEEIINLLNNMSCYLLERGQYIEAENSCLKALKISEQVLGVEHYITGDVVETLATIYCEQGKYALAEEFCKRAVEIDAQTFGTENPVIGTLLNKLGTIYRHQGEYNQAEEVLVHASTIIERFLGSDSHQLADNLKNLAILYHEQGKYNQAEPLYQKALTILNAKARLDNPTFAILLGTIAEFYREQGKYNQAEPLYQQTLATLEEVLGPDHPKLASSINNFALFYYNQGKYNQAEPLFKQAFSIFSKVFDEDHPTVGTNINNLALLYRDQGKYDQAEPLFKRALEIQEKALGSEHPEVANCINNLGALYRLQRKYNKAEPLYQRSLTILEKTLGSNHTDLANVLGNLAVLYSDQNRHGEAEPLLQRALDIRKHALGINSPIVAKSIASLGLVYYYQHKYQQAEIFLKQALTIHEQALGEKNEDTINMISNLGLTYFAQEEYNKAKQLFISILKNERNITISDALKVVAFTNLADVYYKQDDYKQAEICYEQAIAILEDASEVDQLQMAEVFDRLALLYCSQEKYDKAGDLLERSLMFREQMWGQDNADVAISYFNLAYTYHRQGKYKQAEPFYIRALTISKQSFGTNHPQVSEIENHYSKLLQEINNKIKTTLFPNQETKTSHKTSQNSHSFTNRAMKKKKRRK